MHVRQAVLEDIPAFVELGREMHAESIFNRYNFDATKLAAYLQQLIESDWGIVLTLIAEESIAGGFAGVIVPHWFGHDAWASDIALFVSAAHRDSRAGLLLLNHYVETARQKGADQIVMANSTGYESDRVAKLFGSVGFEKVGYVMSMHVPKGGQ